MLYFHCWYIWARFCAQTSLSSTIPRVDLNDMLLHHYINKLSQSDKSSAEVAGISVDGSSLVVLLLVLIGCLSPRPCWMCGSVLYRFETLCVLWLLIGCVVLSLGCCGSCVLCNIIVVHPARDLCESVPVMVIQCGVLCVGVFESLGHPV